MDAKAVTGAFTGKHKGVFIAAAGGVALLAFIMRNKSAGTTDSYAATYPTDTGGSVGSGGGGSSGGITADQMVSALDANSKTFSAQLEEERKARLAYQNGTLQALNNISSSFDSKYASLNASLTDMEHHTTEPVYTSSPATGGFNPNASAGGGGTVSQEYHAPMSTPTTNTRPVYGPPAPVKNTLGFSGATDKANTAADAAYVANPTKANQNAAEKAFIAAAQARDAKDAAKTNKKAG
jgi:hypothetical protein